MADHSLERTQRWYTRIAPVYDLVCRPLYAKPRRRAIEAMELGGGERVLEVGCGTGLNLAQIAEEVGPRGRVLGVDATWGMLRRAHRRVERLELDRVRLHEGDLLEPPMAALKGILMKHLGTAHPDVVLCSYLFAIAPEWEDLFARAWQLLRPGGLFVIVDTRPLQGKWRFLNPLVIPFANWSGGGDLRRATAELLSDRPLAELQSSHGGGVYVVSTRKIGKRLTPRFIMRP